MQIQVIEITSCNLGDIIQCDLWTASLTQQTPSYIGVGNHQILPGEKVFNLIGAGTPLA